MNPEYDRKDLKIRAYQERVSQLTVEYEEKVADLRIDLTIAMSEIERLNAEKEADVTENTED